jgi:hypothetical protein
VTSFLTEYHRYYQIAGLTIQIQADLPINQQTFHSKFSKFEISPVPNPTIRLKHHFSIPPINPRDLGLPVYRKTPWAIYRRNSDWLYLGIIEPEDENSYHKLVFFSGDHTLGEIHSPDAKVFQAGGFTSLSLLPSDQIWLARVLADHQGCFLHAAGMIINRKGLLFAGHSEAGKSTITNLLRDDGEILCDDRIITRRHPQGFQIYGTWSHGDIQEVSPSSAPLRGILFLEQADVNELILLTDKKESLRRLLFLVIKPLVTAEWWHKELDLLEGIIREVPAYVLRFEKNEKVKDIIEDLVK